MLRDRGIVQDFAEILRLHGMESRDQILMVNVKSVLWALVCLFLRSQATLLTKTFQGNIGSTEGGLPFLESEDVIESIVEIAEYSPVLTMRG